MNIDGMNTLACTRACTDLRSQQVRIYPLLYMPVVKDLILDLTQFYEQYAAVKPWLAQLTRRLCIDRLRAGARERPVAEEELAAAEADDTLALLDDALAVHEALAAAPEHCREILDRFFARDESYKTIGEALDLPSGTIASRISRCLARLKTHLEGRSDGSGPSGDR